MDYALGAAGKFSCFKDTQQSVFTIAEKVMLQSDEKATHPVALLRKIKQAVLDFGSADIVNDFVFHNYPSSVAYFDEDLEKTASYLDCLSQNDSAQTYMNRN